MPNAIIETDFHQWTQETAEAVRERRFGSVDWERVAEEMQSLGRAEQNELKSKLAQLMYHLFKIQYQPERSSASWERTIRDRRNSIARLLKEQPSLKVKLSEPDFWTASYEDATALSGPENLPEQVVTKFPDECPFTIEILEA